MPKRKQRYGSKGIPMKGDIFADYLRKSATGKALDRHERKREKK